MKKTMLAVATLAILGGVSGVGTLSGSPALKVLAATPKVTMSKGVLGDSFVALMDGYSTSTFKMDVHSGKNEPLGGEGAPEEVNYTVVTPQGKKINLKAGQKFTPKTTGVYTITGTIYISKDGKGYDGKYDAEFSPIAKKYTGKLNVVKDKIDVTLKNVTIPLNHKYTLPYIASYTSSYGEKMSGATFTKRASSVGGGYFTVAQWKKTPGKFSKATKKFPKNTLFAFAEPGGAWMPDFIITGKNVNTHKVGTYKQTYYAYNWAGNLTKGKTLTVRVVAPKK